MTRHRGIARTSNSFATSPDTRSTRTSTCCASTRCVLRARNEKSLWHAGTRMTPPGNFSFLGEHSPLLAELGATAERVFPYDPASCVLKLRVLAEAITQDIAARLGINTPQSGQADLLRAVDLRLGMDAQVRQL